jgi:hypothetical protein
MKSVQQNEYSRSIIAEIKKEKDRVNFDGMQQGMYPIAIQKSNIAYPVTEGLKTSLEDVASFMSLLKKQKSPEAVYDKASEYSQKFVDVIKLAEKSEGPVFIYSKWIPHGIVGIYSILDALGWEFLGPNFNMSKDVNRYAIWSPGGLDMKGVRPEEQVNIYIKNMRKIFNSPENKDGKLIKILISNVVEGISLKGVNQVHVCEPWWNMSKMEQIIARAIRLCSHASLPENRRYVDVYYHASILNSYPNYDGFLQSELKEMDPKMIYYKDLSRSTIEQKMYITAEKKQNINVQFELALKQSSIDCNINKNGNIVRLEETLIPSIQTDSFIETGGRLPLYNRSNNKYYLLENEGSKFYLIGLDILNEIEIKKPSKKSTSFKKIHNWPPIGIQRNDIKIELEDWQIKTVGGNVSITILEDTLFNTGEIGSACDISGPISKKNFKKLYELVSKDEEYSAWKYCYDVSLKTQLFGKIAVEYNLISGGSPIPLQNKLYSLVENADTNGIWDGMGNKERKKHINTLETLLLKKEALKDKQELISQLYNMVPYNIKDKLNNYSYTELSIIKEKIKLQKHLTTKVTPDIQDKLNSYSIQELRDLNKRFK